MKIQIKYSRKTEINRIIYTYANIAKNIYQNLGFLLLHELPTKNSANSVIIPDQKIEITKEIQKLLEEEASHTGHNNEKENPQTYKIFSKTLTNLEIINEKEIAKFKSNWKAKEEEIIKTISSIFPNNPYTEILIIPTKYGTLGSYDIEDKKRKINIIIRIDQPIEYIVALIVKAIAHYTFLNLGMNDDRFVHSKSIWNKKEELADMLIKNTKLSELCPNYESTIELLNNPEIDTELKEKSDINYSKLGYPSTKALKLNGRIIKINEEEIKTLTETQHNLLLNFLKKEGKIIENEEIAQIMWGKDYYDSYSLSAMAKMIHQLRQKLKEAGLQKEVIFTKRGKGYVLVQ